jgi:tRNA dimethylallyltransferase
MAAFTDCWFLTGPTAAGKTAVGLELARLLDAEIVSMDSMAVYRGMDIGTAKPTAAEQAAVRHHLIDLVEPAAEFSVAQYLEAAEAAVADIRSRGRQVLFVGGTPLYLKALLYGLSAGPAADWELRRQLQELAHRGGGAALHRRLAQVDPVAAQRLHPNDVRRVIRALEVFHATGQPISAGQADWIGAVFNACKVYVLDWPRRQLHDRINRRVEQMFAQGFVDEVRRVLAASPALGRTAAQAVGYRQVLEHLAGRCDLTATVQRVQAATRQFAKRQLTWFRSLRPCRWIAVEEPLVPQQVARQIKRLGQPSGCL